MNIRHVLDLASLPADTLRTVLDEAHRLKAAGNGRLRARSDILSGRVLAMLFERPSTRTRFSFDVAMRELGGSTIVSAGAEMQLGRGETMADTARVLSRYVDAIMVRMLDHGALEEFASHCEVPVINGLTRRSHPCQIVADIMTVEERFGASKGVPFAWVGDGNNVLATLLEAAPKLGYAMRIATPPDLSPPDDAVCMARNAGAAVQVFDDPAEAVAGAKVVVTDAWVSMGDDDEGRRRTLLAPYQVNAALLAKAAPDAIVLHCLPAHRGEEITDEVLDGPQSAVFDEAENRVHVQKAILAYTFGLIG